MAEIEKGLYMEKDGVFGRLFNIHNKNYYAENQVLYKKNKIFIPENSVSCLVGCNGIGKSTVIRQMIHDNENCLSKTAWDLQESHSFSLRGLFEELPKREDFDEFYMNGNKNSSFGYSDDDFLKNDISTAWCSTGEANLRVAGPVFSILGQETKLLAGKRLFVFLDDLDVGVSIDYLREVVSAIKTMEKVMSERGIKFYIILTANSYELAKHFNCIDSVSFKPVKFKDYEDYADYVVKTREYKNNRDR